MKQAEGKKKFTRAQRREWLASLKAGDEVVWLWTSRGVPQEDAQPHRCTITRWNQHDCIGRAESECHEIFVIDRMTGMMEERRDADKRHIFPIAMYIDELGAAEARLLVARKLQAGTFTVKELCAIGAALKKLEEGHAEEDKQETLKV